MHRITALAAVCLIALCAACGSGSHAQDTSALKQPTDPKSVPTSTLPAILPTAMPAVTVTEGTISGQLNTAPTSYTVQQGDTLAGIAQKLGVTLSALNSYNAGLNPSNLSIGQVIRVPPAATSSATATPGAFGTTRAGTVTAGTATVGTQTATPAAGGQTYTVKSGDTACVIAGKLGVSLSDLAAANGGSVSALAKLKIGQVLKVPTQSSASPGC